MIQVINICKDQYDLRKKFNLDKEMFESASGLDHKVSSSEIPDGFLIKVNNHENYYFLLDRVEDKIKTLSPNSINVFEITPTLDHIRFFHHLVLKKEGEVSIKSKIK